MISFALPANRAPLAGESSAHQVVSPLSRNAPRNANAVSIQTDAEITPASNLLTGKQTAEKRASVTGKQTALPKAKGTPPPKVKGYSWRADGSGWQARRLWTDDNGKRRQTYVAHLSREAFSKLRRQHRKPDAMAKALADWTAEREREKGNR